MHFLRSCLDAGDYGFLLTYRHGFDMSHRHTDAPDTDLFRQHQPALYDHDLFDDGYDRRVAFLANGGRRRNHTADRHPLNFDPFMSELFVDQAIARVRDSAHLHPVAANLPSRYRNFLAVERQVYFTRSIVKSRGHSAPHTRTS